MHAAEGEGGEGAGATADCPCFPPPHPPLGGEFCPWSTTCWVPPAGKPTPPHCSDTSHQLRIAWVTPCQILATQPLGRWRYPRANPFGFPAQPPSLASAAQCAQGASPAHLRQLGRAAHPSPSAEWRGPPISVSWMARPSHLHQLRGRPARPPPVGVAAHSPPPAGQRRRPAFTS